MTRRKSLLRSPGVLFIAFTLMLATAGFVYTHWTTTQTLEVQTNAGSLWVQWNDGYTNDDGVDNGDGELASNDLFDYWGDASSLDPSEPGWGGARYPKDVGGCWIENLGSEFVEVNVQNAYPSYYCTFMLDFAFRGSVPARVTASNIEAWVDTDAWCYNDDNGTPDDPDDDFGVRWPGAIGWDESVGDFADFNGDGLLDSDEPGVGYCDGYPRWPMALEFNGDGTFGMVDPHPAYGFAELTGEFGGPLGKCGMQVDPVGCGWFYDVEEGDPPGPATYQWDGWVNCDQETCWAEVGDNEPDGNFDGDDFEVYEVCGSSGDAGGWVHLENASVQGATYSFHVSQEYVNYNEFDYCMCNDDADAYDEAGTWIGTVDHLVDGCLVEAP